MRAHAFVLTRTQHDMVVEIEVGGVTLTVSQNSDRSDSVRGRSESTDERCGQLIMCVSSSTRVCVSCLSALSNVVCAVLRSVVLRGARARITYSEPTEVTVTMTVTSVSVSVSF